MGKKKVAQISGSATDVQKDVVVKTAGSTKKIDSGIVFISVTFNNTIVTVTDAFGNVVAWASAGSMGFNGPKKATPFAASKVVTAIAEKIKRTGPFNVSVVVRGVGGGRDAAVRALASNGFSISSVRDATPIPHNGPRPCKVRRV